MEVKNAIDLQIGGSHYKTLQMQPVEFIVSAGLSYIQGNIVKYITRYKHKNGKQDVEKCMHYAQLAIELQSNGPRLKALNLAYSYCKVNKLNKLQTNIIAACVQDDYYLVIRYCKHLIHQEYKT